MEKINIGLVGAGRIAGHHIRSIRKLKKLNIVSICDLDIDKAKYYGDKYKINIYSHYDEMLKTEKKNRSSSNHDSIWYAFHSLDGYFKKIQEKFSN